MNGSPNHKVFNDFTELFADSVAFYEAALATENSRSIITNTKLSILLGVFAF